MSNYAIPIRPLAGATRHIADLLTDFDYVTARMDEIANSRRLIGVAGGAIQNSTATGTYFMGENGGMVASGSGTPFAVIAWNYVFSNMTISALTKIPGLVLRAAVATNTSSSSAALNVQLVPVTWSGSGNNIVPTAGASVMSVPFSAPIAGGGAAVAEATHAVPADGYYAPVLQITGGACPATFLANVHVQLFMTES
jgi:hypothetical protein